MWKTTRQAQEDEDDSWEVRAFAEDTCNTMGTTWPPRSYTCTFCRREFRSAQALGGHMNVHRRDRARLRQSPTHGFADPSSSLNSSSALILPTQEFVSNGGLFLLYPLPSPNSVLNSTSIGGLIMDQSPSSLLTASNSISSNCSAFDLPVTSLPQQAYSSLCHHSADQVEPTDGTEDHGNNDKSVINTSREFIEELDLELRLGSSRPTP